MRSCRENGQALIEFVLILPILLFLVFGMIDFGRIFYHKLMLVDTLDEVARRIEEQNYNTSQFENIIADYSTKYRTLSIYVEEDHFLNLSIKEELSFVTPGIGFLFEQPYILSKEKVVYNEND